MRLNHRSAPLRFIGGVVGGWIAIRVVPLLLWPQPGVVPMMPGQVRVASVEATPAIPIVMAALAQLTSITDRAPARPAAEKWHGGAEQLLLLAAYRDVPTGPIEANYVRWSETSALDPPAPAAMVAAPLTVPASAAPASRWSGSAWAYLRQGSGLRPLAGGGQLGGSQAGGRVAYAVLPRLALAARGYAAIGQPGREVALGAEWQPAPSLRIAVERRIAADAAGRDAFSAYAAGGFWQEADGVVIDGYAQAGVVGLRARDLFADGAVRLGRRVGSLTLGAGAWGAAQPGAERIDVGPRAAVRFGNTPVSLAVEQRFRILGDAHPGSGLALTLAADF